MKLASCWPIAQALESFDGGRTKWWKITNNNTVL